MRQNFIVKRINPKYIRSGAFVLLGIMLLLLIVGTIAVVKRESLLQAAIAKAIVKARRDYNLDVKIGSAHFKGLSTVSFSNITIVPQNRDSLLNIQEFEVGVKLWPLLFGEVKLSSVKLNDGWINLVNKPGLKNYDFLFKKKKDSTDHKTGDLAALANNLVNDVLYKIPDELDLKNFNIKYHDDSTAINIATPTATIAHSVLQSTIVINNGESVLHFGGNMRPSDKYFDISLFADHKKVELPFLQRKFGLKLSFDTISTQLKEVDYGGGETRIYGAYSVKNLVINHPKLATGDIVIPNGAIDANVFIGQNYVSLDSSSVIHLNQITVNPYIKYTLTPAKIYELKLHLGMTDAQQLFNSFPQGTFDALAGIKVEGKLGYDFNFYLDSANPDDVKFDSNLLQDNFRIVKYGQTDLTKLNAEFVYTPFEKDKPMPSRVIGASNPYYTPIEDISPYLQHAVMTAEDPSFYNHHGFVPEAIRKSIAVDFKEKKFKRGGSTISMQLVKNAFLNRHKTMARKVEEIFIVWMIENAHIISKTRMLEVYLNIIEWGNNVYGIGEASRYYFGKTPAELNLGESIYLASIVPKPKAGLYAFEADGSLKPYLLNYFETIGGLMAQRGFTEADSSGYGYTDVLLKASLRQKVSVADSIKAAADLLPDDDMDAPAIDIENKRVVLPKTGAKRDTVGH